ncbi:lectin [Fluviispira vulneris]|uniref:lectin n=1 Tax=Fluviispira vulneris TaxID=2763012 RepID=UPI001649779E|nr:lectin [Fluviispira vulneris]
MFYKSIFALVLSFSALFASTASAVDTLVSGQTLYVGNRLDSANRCFRLVMQADDNLVIYRNSNNHPTWASGTNNTGSYRAAMQGDGNFVIYNSSKATWASGTYGHHGAWLILQNDGNLVIYKANSWNPIWASNSQTGC